MDLAEAIELALPVYFPDSAPVLVIMFNQTSVAKSFDTHEHLGQVMPEQAGG